MSAPHPRHPDNTPSLDRVMQIIRSPYAPPEQQHAERAIMEVNGYPRDLDAQTESEVMPIVSSHSGRSDRTIDTKPQSATGADRLADLATLLRLLTWGEMDEFSSGINADPKTIHQWSHK